MTAAIPVLTARSVWKALEPHHMTAQADGRAMSSASDENHHRSAAHEHLLRVFQR